MAEGVEHLAAIADADPDRDDDQCGAWGPDGQCFRERGHYDGAWRVNVHVTFDNDRYQDWPVGWRSKGDLIKAVHDPTFGSALTGNADYRRGAEDMLRLVRANLKG